MKSKPKLLTPSPAKLDLGCGPNKRLGFFGIDSRKFNGVDLVHDLTKPWPFPDSCIEEAHTSHCVEHFDAMERVHFVNELWRVLKPGGKCTLIVPHWSSCRAYGDLTHKWPPVSEFWFYYLKKEWRAANAPHNDFYNCDFEVTWGYSLDQPIAARNQEYQQHALRYWKEAAQDMVATLTALKG